MAISVSVSKHGLLTMRIDRDGDSVVVRALGQLDIGTSKHLEEELRQALRCDASPVVLDLGKVDFIENGSMDRGIRKGWRVKTSTCLKASRVMAVYSQSFRAAAR